MDDISLLEAIEFAKNRKVLLPADFYKLDLDTRRYATTVSQLGALSQIQTVLDAVNKTLADGGTFKDFQDLVAQEGIELSRNHLDNIFRTNVQNAYAHGRWAHQQANKGKRPYLKYSAIQDVRTRPTHLALNNVIRHIDDPFWKTHYPPNGFRCRCSITSLTDKQAERQGITPDDKLPEFQVDKGWNFHPADYTEHPSKIVQERLDRELTNKDPVSAVNDPVVQHLQERQLELDFDKRADDRIIEAMPEIQLELFEEAVEKTVGKGMDVRPSDLAITIGLSDGDSSLIDLVKTSALQKDQENSIGRRILDKIKGAFDRVFSFAKNTKDKLTGNSIRGIDDFNLNTGNIIGIQTPTLFKTAKQSGKNITILDAKGVAIDLSRISGLDGALLAPDLNLEVVSNDDNGLVLRRTKDEATRYFVANQSVYSLY